MNYHIKCSICSPLADTHVCSRLWLSRYQRCQWFFSGKADQIN